MTEVIEKKVADIKKEAQEHKCPVQASLYYVDEFLAGPMCGKCFPCEMGTYEARVRLRNLTEGRGTKDDIASIKKIAEEMQIASRCKKGKDTADFILEWMETGDFDEHVAGTCRTGECKSLLVYRIISEKCILCGLCQDACKYNAIVGEKKVGYKSGFLPFEIRQRRCVKCGDCVPVCPTGAIEVVELSKVKAETAEPEKVNS